MIGVVSRWAQATFAALGSRDFRVLWLGTFGAFVAFFMSTVVQSVVAFELTGQNSAVGWVGFAQGVAMLPLGLLGGAFADRWPKRRVVVICQSATATVFLTLALLHASGGLRLIHLMAGSLAMGSAFAFLGPARQALVMDLVADRTRGNAMALQQIANNASRLLGPSLAGLLLAWSFAGATGAYLVMSSLYAGSAASMILLPKSRVREGARDQTVFADLAEGLRYVAGNRRLRLLLVFYVSLIGIAYPYVTVLPGLVEHEFGRDASSIALLYLLSAAGGLSVSLLVARYADTTKAFAIYTAMAALFCLSLFALASSPNYPVAIAFMLVVGMGSGGFQSLNAAVVVNHTDMLYIGRVMSLTMLAFSGFHLMALPVGLLADAIGERPALALMAGAATLLVLTFSLRIARLPAEESSQEPSEAEVVRAAGS